ncbi:type IV-A pilus assembly ATPase PilB [soil metagenome]
MATAMERKLGEMLVKDKVITPQELESAISQQESSKRSLGHVLIEMGLTSEWEMAAALGKQLNVPFITLSHYEIDAQVLGTLPREIVKKYKIVPVDKTGDTLTIALSDPSNIYLLDELKLLTKFEIIPVISFESDINEAINRYYPGLNDSQGPAIDEALKEIESTDMKSAVKNALELDSLEVDAGDIMKDEGGDDAEVNDAPVITLVNMIITEAIKSGASDIHIEPYEKKLRLRYRIDGVLNEMTNPPKKCQNAIISRIKILSEMDIAERRLPQDGRFRVKVQGRPIDFRVSTCPIIAGEKVVMRILDQSNLMLNLEDLGFEPQVKAKFESAILKPFGMCLITGPTGSGKSTTLYSALSRINDPAKNISTIEDPVEYNLPGINQVNAKQDMGLTFAVGLKAFLRQDPDIIMVGEIRDLETGAIAIKAALTGHLVLSTLHTNDAPSTVQRLINMGIDDFLITASLNMIQAQRLARRICKNCRTEYVPEVAELKTLGLPEEQITPDIRLYRGKGCEVCRMSGYKGRVGLYEVMLMNDRLKDLVMAGSPTNQFKKAAIEEGMESMRMAAVRKTLQGATTVEQTVELTMED